MRVIQTLTVVCSDFIATVSAFLLAYWLRFVVEVTPPKELLGTVPGLRSYLILLPPILVLWPLVFAAFGLYRLRRTTARAEEYIQVAIALTLAMALFAAGAFMYKPVQLVPIDGTEIPVPTFPFSRLMLGMFYLLDMLLVVAGRSTIHAVLDRVRRSGRNLKRVLIAGTGTLARTVVDKIRLHQEFGYRLVGMLSEEPGAESYRGVPVAGLLHEASSVIRAESADQLYIALPLSAHQEILQLLHDVSNEIVEVKVVPDLLQYITLRAGVEDLDGVPIVNLSATPLRGVGSFLKRAVDILAATSCLLFFSPLFPLIALVVLLSSRGPVLYRQERMGLDGRSFKLLKFRSMRVDAESGTGPIWAAEHDPRVTPVGRFLRKYSLDELPQFWNVLRGDMSMVGPRPERPHFVQEFRNRIPHYMLRHRVRAGLTGWAQVNGWRGNTSLEKRIEYDLYYIEHWSLTLDLKILWMTLATGLSHEHAY
ncbi:MAG: undecaprenyl-phosphate glucose phosphotransferase [Acidobacteriota bacterium]